jgi:TonB family protein
MWHCLICAGVVLLGVVGNAVAQEPVVYRSADPGVKMPVVLDQSLPHYTPDAMLAGIQGRVKLECVVLADGSVRDIRLVEPLFPSLDEQVIEAVKTWRFRPGTKDGQPVAVRVEIEHVFTMGGVPRRTGRIYVPGDQGVTAPRIHREVKGLYPAALKMPAPLEPVMVEVVVLRDGTVRDAKVTQKVAPDLAAAAIEAVRQWRFYPGWKDGEPVATRVTVTVALQVPN